MADLRVHRDRLEIHLTTAEKALSLRKANLVVPRDAIRSVAITEDPWIWIRGVRAPGTSIPLTLAVGTWKFHGGKDFLIIKGKQRSAVVVDIEAPIGTDNAGTGAGNALEFARIVVSTQHAADLVEALRVDPADGADAETDEAF